MKKFLDMPPIRAVVEKLSHEGRGIVSIDGKTVFVSDALPGETIEFRYSKRHKQYDEGQVVTVLNASPDRVTPVCQHFGICGGCALQHYHPNAQLQHKEQVLLEQLRHFGDVTPKTILPPLIAANTGYRRRARLGVRFLEKTQEMLVGFRERGGRYLTRSEECPVLDFRVGKKITAIKQVCAQLSIKTQVPQIEVIATDDTVALVFRVLQDLSNEDRTILQQFGAAENFQILIEPNKPAAIYPLFPEQDKLPAFSYTVDNDLTLQFQPGDFTQVNSEMNRLMINQVLQQLAPTEQDHILELFSGLGNFTLPLARRAATVTAVEGDSDLVARARHNAELNHLSNIYFHVKNLFEEVEKTPWWQAKYTQLLLDPPRLGAEAVCEQIHLLKIKKIVYISCHPATLARDAGILVHKKGYTLKSVGAMDMFPATSHVEAIAVFEKLK